MTEGMAEGMAEGEVKGERKKTIEMAKAMKLQGVDAAVIIKISGLSHNEIEQL